MDEQGERDKMERVEKHLYRVQHRTKTGEWSIRYYAIFRDWNRISRSFPLGEDLEIARDRLGELRNLNGRRFDFDAERRQQEEAKQEAQRAVTFSEWAERYFSELAPGLGKRPASIDTERHLFKKLRPFFGPMTLPEINRSAVMAYRTKRAQEKGGPITVNREFALLRYLLNLAADDGIIENAPKLQSRAERKRQREAEAERARDRTASPEEYAALLASVKRPVQRVLICLYETAMRIGEVLKLTWDKVNMDEAFIRLAAGDTKERKPRSVPVSPTLMDILRELKAERPKFASITPEVFTRHGRPIKTIRNAFERAKRRAKIEDLHLHDFRHTCITNWDAAGISEGSRMAAAGHHSAAMSHRYTNPKERHLRVAFAGLHGTPAGGENPSVQAEPFKNGFKMKKDNRAG